jgi:hypothetical protein
MRIEKTPAEQAHPADGAESAPRLIRNVEGQTTNAIGRVI